MKRFLLVLSIIFLIAIFLNNDHDARAAKIAGSTIGGSSGGTPGDSSVGKTQLNKQDTCDDVNAFMQLYTDGEKILCNTAPEQFTAIKQAASTTATGVVETAIQSEVDTGSDTLRYVTPETLKGRLFSNATQILEATDAIDCTLDLTVFVSGNAIAVNLTSNPQIVVGTTGQQCTIVGTSDTESVTLETGNGLVLPSACVLTTKSHVVMKYDGVNWTAVAGTCFSADATTTTSNTFTLDSDSLNYYLKVVSGFFEFRQHSDDALLGIRGSSLDLQGDGTSGFVQELGGGDASTEPSGTCWNQGADGGTEKWVCVHPTADGRLRKIYDSDGTLSAFTDSTGELIPQHFIHATDCTAVTTGLAGDTCWEQDDNVLYECEPTAGGCDTAGEWIRPAITLAGQTECEPFLFESPADADNWTMPSRPYARTITSVNCLVDPAGTGESVVIRVDECDANGDSCAGVDGATTITCGNTNTADDGTLSNPSIDANDYMAIDIGTVTGTVTQLSGRYCWTR